jgi:hypothetical protein
VIERRALEVTCLFHIPVGVLASVGQRLHFILATALGGY